VIYMSDIDEFLDDFSELEYNIKLLRTLSDFIEERVDNMVICCGDMLVRVKNMDVLG